MKINIVYTVSIRSVEKSKKDYECSRCNKFLLSGSSYVNVSINYHSYDHVHHICMDCFDKKPFVQIEVDSAVSDYTDYIKTKCSKN